MDSSRGKMRINVEDDDRLSTLPDALIHKILSFISIKHAIQTSVLSSRWRFIWTSMPYLNFSRNDFAGLPKFSEFVTHVLSDRDNQTEVSSVDLSIHGEDSDVFVKQIMKYALSHNIKTLNVASLVKNVVEFPLFLFSSQSLKQLSLTLDLSSGRQYHSLRPFSYVFKGTSTLELPLLTTLHLEHVILRCDDNSDDKCIDLFSKCTNLKNLTLIGCNLKGCKVLSICLPLLSNLELHQAGCGSLTVINIVAPQLKNLSITDFLYNKYLISAPNLVSLIYKGYHCLQLPANDYLFLEKADICVKYPKCAHEVLSLLQQLHNVKFLTLSLEIVKLLSSSVELMSNQPSPFANLKSLKIHPERDLSEVREHERVKMSAEVRGYLLDSSPGATFTMVSREEVAAMHDTKLVQNLIKQLRSFLEKEKAGTESKMAMMHEQGKTHVDVDMSWKDLSVQIEEGKEKASIIISMLKNINKVLTRLPASNRATIQPSFSTLCAETDIVMKKITDFIKMDCDENQRRLSLCFHELATNLQSSS